MSSRYVVQVRDWRPIEAGEEEVMGLTEAAKRLGLGDASSVADLCLTGRLRWLRDTAEPNSRKQGRVLRADVAAELARRRGRRDDGRLKVKRPRR